MEFFKVFFAKIGHLFLGIIAAVRRALCCFRKRRRSSDVALPITSIDVSSITATKFEASELQDWEVWNEGPTSIAIESTRNNRSEPKNVQEEEESVDYFQDMMPSIRRPKKFVMKGNTERSDVHTSSGNRFGVNSQATVSHNPELGVIDDHIETWEDVATEDLWDAESVLREQRIVEREKRLAEHQKRKHEKEAKRLGKPDASMLTKLS